MSTLIFWAQLIAVIVGVNLLRYWKPTACRCGRERLPWFTLRHEKEWIMFLWPVLQFGGAVTEALSGGPMWITIGLGLLGVLSLRSAIEHRKGKKPILGKLLGRVRVNRHGRLVVEQ